MSEYRSSKEQWYSNVRHIVDGGTPVEFLNFKEYDDGLFRGYVAPTRIAIEKLGVSKRAPKVSPVIVVFCAPHKQNGGLRIVGFYRDATVFRAHKSSKLPDRPKKMQATSNDAVLIPESDRHFTIPSGKGGFGTSNLWYGLNNKECSSLREDVLNYVQDPTALPESQPSVIEHRQRQLHELWDGRGNNRHFIHEKGFCCEACNYAISEVDQPIWGSGFELHHLRPWSDLLDGDVRLLDTDDFAVLCATCHRAIHQSKYVSDVALFREKILAKRDNIPRQRRDKRRLKNKSKKNLDGV